MSNSPVWDGEKDSEGRVIDNSSDDMVFTKKPMNREKVIEQQLIETEIAKADAKEKCGIKHGFGDQTCTRERGHDGLCRSRAAGGGGTVTFSEWESRDGKFYSHVGYRTIYPKNAKA